MIRFHAVMLDETGCEFGADVEAMNHGEASDKLADMYPESRCVQLESPEETAARQQRIYEWALRSDGDDYDEPDFYEDDDYDDMDEDELAELCLN